MPPSLYRCWCCCQMSFGKKNLLKHIEQNHGASPWYCHVCRIDCSCLDVLLRHVYMHDLQSAVAARLRKPRPAASEEELLYLHSPLATGRTAGKTAICNTEEASRLVSTAGDVVSVEMASCTNLASRQVSSAEDLVPEEVKSCTEKASRFESSTEDLAPEEKSCTEEALRFESSTEDLAPEEVKSCIEEALRFESSTEDLAPEEVKSCIEEALRFESSTEDLAPEEVKSCIEEALRFESSVGELPPEEATLLDSGLIPAPATGLLGDVENNAAATCLLIISDEKDATPAAELVGNAGDFVYIIPDDSWSHVFDEMSISETVVPHSEIECPSSKLSEGIGGGYLTSEGNDMPHSEMKCLSSELSEGIGGGYLTSEGNDIPHSEMKCLSSELSEGIGEEYLTSEGNGTAFPTQGSDQVSGGINIGFSSSITGLKDCSRSSENPDRNPLNWPFSFDRKEGSSSSAVRFVEEVLQIESNHCLPNTEKHTTETENVAGNLNYVSSAQNTEQPLLFYKEVDLKEVKTSGSVAFGKTDNDDSLGKTQFKEEAVDCRSKRRKQTTYNTVRRRRKKYGKVTGLSEVPFKEVTVKIDKLPLSIVKGRTVLVSEGAEENNNTKWNETSVLIGSLGTAVSTENEDSVKVEKSQVLSTTKFQKKQTISRSKKAQRSTSTKATLPVKILARPAGGVFKKKQVTWADTTFSLPKPILPTVQDLSVGKTQKDAALLVCASPVYSVSTINGLTSLNFDNVRKCEPIKSGILKTLYPAPAPPANNLLVAESKCKKRVSRKATGQKPANLHSLGEKPASNCAVSPEVTSEQNSVSPVQREFQTIKTYMNRQLEMKNRISHCSIPTTLIQNMSKEEDHSKEEQIIEDIPNHVIKSKYDGMTCQTEDVQGNVAGDVTASPRLYEDCYAEAEWPPDNKQGWECVINDKFTQPVNQESESSPMDKDVVLSRVPLPKKLLPPTTHNQLASDVHTVNELSQGTEAVCEELLFQNSCSDLHQLDQALLFESNEEITQQEIQTDELSANPSVVFGSNLIEDVNSSSKTFLKDPEELPLAVPPSQIKNVILSQTEVKSMAAISPALGFQTSKDPTGDIMAGPSGNPIDLETKEDQQIFGLKKVSNSTEIIKATPRKRSERLCSQIIDLTAVSDTTSHSGENTVVPLQRDIRDTSHMPKMSEAIEENPDEADRKEITDITDDILDFQNQQENAPPVSNLVPIPDDNLPANRYIMKTHKRGKTKNLCSWSSTKQTRNNKSVFCVAEQTGEPFKSNWQEERAATDDHSDNLDGGIITDLVKEGSSDHQVKSILAENITTRENNVTASEDPLPPVNKKHKSDKKAKAKKRPVWDYCKRRRSTKSNLEATPDSQLHCDSSVRNPNCKKTNNGGQHTLSEFCDAVQCEEKLLAVSDTVIDTTVSRQIRRKRKNKTCCVDEKPVKLLELNEEGENPICHSRTAHGNVLNGKSCDKTADLVKRSTPELIQAENLPKAQDVALFRDPSPDIKNMQLKEENAFVVAMTAPEISLPVVNEIKKTQIKGIAKEESVLSLSKRGRRMKPNLKFISQSSNCDAGIKEPICKAKNEKNHSSLNVCKFLEQGTKNFLPKSAESSTSAIPCCEILPSEIERTGRSRKRKGCFVQHNGKQTKDVQSIELEIVKSMDLPRKTLLEEEEQLITTKNLLETRGTVLSEDISIECNNLQVRENNKLVVPMNVSEISDEVSPTVFNSKKTQSKGKAVKNSILNSSMKRRSMDSICRDAFQLTPCDSEVVEKISGRGNKVKERTSTEFCETLEHQAQEKVSRETRSKRKAKLCVAKQTGEPFKSNWQEERGATDVHSEKLGSGINTDLVKEGSSDHQVKSILAENITTRENNVTVSEDTLPPVNKKHKSDKKAKAKKRPVWDYCKRRRSTKSKLKATPDSQLHCDSSVRNPNCKKTNNGGQHTLSEFCDAVQCEEKLLAVSDTVIDTTVSRQIRRKRKNKTCCVDEKPVKLLELNEEGENPICHSRTAHGNVLNGKSCDKTADLVKRSTPELIKAENLPKAQDVALFRDPSPDIKNMQLKEENAFVVAMTAPEISLPVVNEIKKTQIKGMAKEESVLSLSKRGRRMKSNLKFISQSSNCDAVIIEPIHEAKNETNHCSSNVCKYLEQDSNNFSLKSTETPTLPILYPEILSAEIPQTGRNQKNEHAVDFKQKEEKLTWAGTEDNAVKLDAGNEGDLVKKSIPDRLDDLIIVENPTSEEQPLLSVECNGGPWVILERLNSALIGLHKETADISIDPFVSCGNYCENEFTTEDTLTGETGLLVPSCSKSQNISLLLDCVTDENYTLTSVQQSEGQSVNESPAKRKRSRKSSKPMKILKLDEIVCKHIPNDLVGLNNVGEPNIIKSVVKNIEPQALTTGESIIVQSDVPVTADVPVRMPRKSSIPQKRLLPLSEDIRHAGLRILEDEHLGKKNRGRRASRACSTSDGVFTPVSKVHPEATPKIKNALPSKERDTKTRKVTNIRKAGKQHSSNSVASKRKPQMPKLVPVKKLKDPITRGRRMPILAVEGTIPEVNKTRDSNLLGMLSPLGENNKPKRRKTTVAPSVPRKILEVSPSPMDGMLLSTDGEIEDFIPLKKPEIEYFETYCQLCGSQFPSKELRDDHFQDMHVIGESKRCLVCGKHFNRKDQLNYHLMVHFNCRPFPCNLCLKSFVRKDHLIRHTYTHKDEF